MNQKVILKLLLVSCLFIVISCRDKADEEFLLTPEQKSLVPYTEGEKIVFKSSESDMTMSYVASAPNFYFKENNDGYNPYYRYENLDQALVYDNGEIFFHMGVTSHQLKTQFMFFWKNNFEGFPNVVNTIWLPLDTVEDKSLRILSDYEISGKIYQNVFVADLSFPSSYSDTVFNGLVYPMNFYFSRGYGVIKMDMSDSTSFVLGETNKLK